MHSDMRSSYRALFGSVANRGSRAGKVSGVRKNRSPVFRGRHFQDEVIVLCVRWYLRYSFSYRDLEEMMAERGLSIDHSTIARWVLRYICFIYSPGPVRAAKMAPHALVQNPGCRQMDLFVSGSRFRR
jgi:hypothetical protein